MKKKIIDLQVDFIGDQTKTLKKDEEMLISKFISDHKSKRKSKAQIKKATRQKKQPA